MIGTAKEQISIGGTRRAASARPIMVLGGTGFLGTHVCDALRRRPDRPAWVGVARCPPPDARAQDRWYTLDLVTAPVSVYAQLLRQLRPAVVINCAGVITGPNPALRAANVQVVRKLLAALSSEGPVQLIQLGSAAEYGPQPEGSPVAESAAPHPASPYAMTKLMATNLVAAAIRDRRLEGTILRVFNPVGAGAPEYCLAGQAARAMHRAMAERRRTITLGPLEVYRDFIAAEDVGTAAALAAATTDLPPILNVGRGVAMSGDALITLLEGAAGFDGEVIESGRGSPRSAWVPWQRADVTLLRQHLGWTPATPLAHAVAALWAATA